MSVINQLNSEEADEEEEEEELLLSRHHQSSFSSFHPHGSAKASGQLSNYIEGGIESKYITLGNLS